MMTKRCYIRPALVAVDIQEEDMLCSLSGDTGDDTPNLEYGGANEDTDREVYIKSGGIMDSEW